jgi:predicted nucleic acid-binding protein
MRVVVDASVVAKCLVNESESDKAKTLLLRWAAGSLDLLAPDILAVEIASMLWKQAVRGRLSERIVLLLYREFQEFQVPLWPCESLAEQAFQLALRFQHPVYDCLYVTLAARSEAELVTADDRLWKVFSPVFPGIRLLRDWS